METRIYRVINMMIGGLDRDVSFDKLAQSVNLSPSRLRHLFKEATGVSFAQYLKAQRLEKARHLLESTFLSLKEVMYRAGFTDRSHFVRDFKKAYRMPPLEYRKQYLIAQQESISHSTTRTATG